MSNTPPRQKVLIIEDHPATRKLLQDILQKEFNIFSAQNGEEAVDLVYNNKDIDLILLDVIMPKMDGFEVCKRLKGDAQFANIPIIFLTIMGDDDDEAKGFAAGVSDKNLKRRSNK